MERGGEIERFKTEKVKSYVIFNCGKMHIKGTKARSENSKLKVSMYKWRRKDGEFCLSEASRIKEIR